jgi:glycosyltransferase involved in cell wall biosynthesis
MPIKILFVERQPSEFVSIERVFRLVAAALDPANFSSKFEQMPYANNILSILKNLVFFRHSNADVFHITGHIHYMIFALPAARTVLTIHDSRILNRPKGLRRSILKKVFLDWPVRRARYLTTISEFSKKEIVNATKVKPDKVRVIENPIDPQLKDFVSKPFNSNEPTILQIGTMENKNVPRLIRAISGIRCKLKIIGPMSEEIERAVNEAGVTVQNVQNIAERDLKQEYENADIVAFCSTYEGFGLPIIEAQAAGKLVVTSAISPMTETAGDGAIFVDPLEVGSIRNGILQAINDPDRHAKLIEAGFANIKRFDPRIIAAKYQCLYEEIISER